PRRPLRRDVVRPHLAGRARHRSGAGTRPDADRHHRLRPGLAGLHTAAYAGPMSRPATPGEQLANSLSHGLGLLLAVCALPFLVLEARSGGGLPVAGAAVFGGTAILMYFT